MLAREPSLEGPTHRRLVDPRLPFPPISDRHRRAGRRVNRSYPSASETPKACGRRDVPLHSSAGRSGMSWSARLANSERSTSQAIYATRGKSRGCAPLREFHPIRCPQCGALACKLPATRLLPYAGVRKSLPVRNPYGSEHRRIHQDDHEWRSEWRSNHSLAKRI